MVVGYHRETRAIVDCYAIYQNILNEKKRLGKNRSLFAVVKADAYGHGSVKVAEIAERAGADGFCVALLDEALELRANGITLPILILGYVAPAYANILAEENLSVTVADFAWLEQVQKMYQHGEVSRPVAVHIKLDTGMGRIGFRDESEIKKVATFLSKTSNFFLEGIYTHFATADSADDTYFHMQQQRFRAFRQLFPAALLYVHTANSAAALWHDAWGSNMVRYGISMYGLNPSGTALLAPYQLMEALSLETSLIEVKQVPAGESIGYGATYTTKDREWIGTLPLGYADGLRRSFTGFTVLVEGEKVPIVGRVCMDQCMIRLSKDYPIGTKVTIFGENNGLFQSITEGANYVGTINYEITCGISPRVPRVYVNEDKCVEK